MPDIIVSSYIHPLRFTVRSLISDAVPFKCLHFIIIPNHVFCILLIFINRYNYEIKHMNSMATFSVLQNHSFESHIDLARKFYSQNITDASVLSF